MKLRKPASPFERLEFLGDSVTIDTEGKVLVLPSGNPDILPSHNEYVLNSNRLTILESPFGGLKGSSSPDYAPGTANIIEGDGVYLQDTSGTNSSKTLSAGKLKELNLLTVDTTAHSITEEFIVRNTSVSNNPVVIDDCETVDNWVVQTGRGTITLETNDKISGSGAIKLTVNGAYSECYARLNKSISIASAQFICFYLKGPIGKTGQLYIYDTTGKEAYWNLGTYTGNWQRFVLPLSKPTYNNGINYNLVNALRFDIDNNPVQNDVLLIDNICGDVARPTYLEIQVPDYLADTSAQIYTHNGSAYQLCRTCKLDSAYASVSDIDANCTLADGTKFSDVYGTGNGRSVFPKGESGQSKNGSLAGSSITYSQNKGTLKRIGLRVDLPPAGTAAPNFSAVRLKIVTFYTDVQGNKVLDLSGNGNHGTIVGGVTKLNDGGLRFDGSTGYVAIKTITHTLPVTYAIKVKYAGTAPDRHEINIGIGLDSFSLYERNGQVIARTMGDSTSQLAKTAPTIGTTHIIIAEFTNTYVKIFCDSSIASDTASYTQNTASKTGPLTLGRNSLLEYTNADIYEAAVMHGVLSTAEKDIIFNQNTLSSISTLSGTLLYYQPTTQNMGSTTYVFADSTNASYGLQNVIKPWIALYDPEKTTVDFFLFTHRPRNLEFKRDETGQIHELTLYPGNGRVYHGRITYPNLTEA